MLELFEDVTYDLTDYEKDTLLPLFLQAFQKKIGPEKAITNASIVKTLTEKKYEINDRRVRKIISYIRIHCLLPGLMASSKGYYISKDPEEIKRYVQSLAGREHAIKKIRERVQSYLISIEKAI